MVSLVMSAVRVLRVVSCVMAMFVGVLQVVCWLEAPLVWPVWRVSLGMLWAVVSSVVPMVRVTHAMDRAVAPPFVSIVRLLHRVTVRPVCAVGDATGGGGAGEGAAPGATGDGVIGDIDGEGAAGDGSGDGVVADADGRGGCCG